VPHATGRSAATVRLIRWVCDLDLIVERLVRGEGSSPHSEDPPPEPHHADLDGIGPVELDLGRDRFAPSRISHRSGSGMRAMKAAAHSRTRCCSCSVSG
jgi:hypothetical protein